MLSRLNRAFKKFKGRGPSFRSGFTLVEIMMVLLILSVGLLPIAVIQSRAKKEVMESDRYTQGITVAQAQLERIKSQGFGNSADQAGVIGPVTWTSTITNVSFGLERIDVAVSWPEDNNIQTYTVSDLVSMR